MNGGFWGQALIYLLAAVVAVPIAKRFGLGSVLGYLFAGVLIGPSALGWIAEFEDAQHFGEFGVLMMLFVVGLELRPALLWRLRGPILGTGSGQVFGTAALVTAIGLAFGLTWQEAVTIGLTLALSSTAIVIQSLAEKGQLHTRGGQAAFSVLLFQDIAVIPILALLPWLASGKTASHGVDTGHGGSALTHLPPWLQMIVTLAAVVSVVVAGRFLLRPLFRYIASSKLREMFTAVALLVVVATALLMELVGLSAALGTFIAGVVLADSEYRHELEADIEPFKGLLLGLFFIAVGAGLDLGLVADQPFVISGLVGGLIAVKFMVLLALGLGFRMGWGSAFLFAFALPQAGEFCFVLLAAADGLHLLDVAISAPLKTAVALSMAITPLLMLINERLVQPRFANLNPKREHDEMPSEEADVILAGFGRFGHIIGRLLRAQKFQVTVLDNDPDQVDLLARFGLKAFYGDASRLDLLTAAGAAHAKLFICAIDSEEKSIEVIELVQKHFPHLKILARAGSRQHAYELLKRDVTQIQRETLGSALDLSIDALRTLGFGAHRALRAARLFRKYDEISVKELLLHYEGDQGAYASEARKHIANLERVLQEDHHPENHSPEDSWNSAGSR